MDFDPSQFLAVAMSEDPNSTYTAPDLAQPHEDVMTMEGGLQMEQNLHIPVPVFGSLEVPDESYETEALDNNNLLEPCIEIDDSSPDPPIADSPTNTTIVDRTASPHPTAKKIILTTFEETRFRKEFYNNNNERIKLFRLHCTICEKHLGCAPWLTERQMRMHKLLNVPTCRKCFEFYGDINFPIEDGSEIYCCWCGEGGEVYCCSKCPKIVCKKCIRRNFGDRKIKEIDENDNWCCFVCNPVDIYPHRAMIWGLQRYSREMRQKVAFLERGEKQEQLSKDTSHCCLSQNSECPEISLPYKVIMSKVPLCLIAHPHRKAVINQKDHPQQRHFTIPPMNNIQMPRPNLIPHKMPGTSSYLKNHLNGQAFPIQGQPNQQMFNRGVINRYAPYPGPRLVHSPPQIPQPARYSMAHQVPQRSVPNRSDTIVSSSKQVVNTNSSQANHAEIDIEWLENGIKDVNNTVNIIKKMVDQFIISKDDLKGDPTKLSSFSEKFSHNIKIAICSLAKANQNMLDNRKVVFDNQVSLIVNNIKSSVIINHRPSTPQPPPPPPETDSSQVDEEINDLPSLNAALLCETVMEVEGNKENENGNKYPKSPIKRTPPKPNSLQKRKQKNASLNIRKRNFQKNSPQKSIPVIDLIEDDDDEDGFDASYYIKKYNIKPCRVVLTGCDELK